MTKEIRYTQTNPKLGNLKGVLRIIGKMLYFKFNENQYAAQLIAQMQAKGAEIEKSFRREWIRVNMFKNQSIVKLGNREFDVTKISEEEAENILAEFYMINLTKAGFKCELT